MPLYRAGFGHVYDLGKPEHFVTLLSVLRLPSQQKRVPMMVPEPRADFVHRPLEFGALKAKLLNPLGDAVAITAALRGAGGYGKTTLAKALAHDEDIIEAYFDGILWVELGEQPGNLLSIISDLIETLTAERPALESLNAAASKLGEALGERRILLIIDDAWREQDLRPFLQGGRNTTRLITTRRDDILPVKAERQPVDAMQAGEALDLLAWGLPVDLEASSRGASEPWRSRLEAAIAGLLRPFGPRNEGVQAELEKLAARLGEWAQLLKLVNGFLRDSVVKNRQPLAAAIAGVNARLDKRGLIAFDAKNEVDRAKAIARTIGVSLELLSEIERARFAELAVFPEDVDIPIGIAARLWAKTGDFDGIDTEDLLKRLESLSLLLSFDLDRRSFRFHDTTRLFLQEQAGEGGLIELHKALIDAMEGAGTDEDDASRRYYYLYRPQHMAFAGLINQRTELLLDPIWLQAKFECIGTTQALIEDYEQLGQSEMEDLIRQTLPLIAGICSRDKRQLLPQLYGRLLSYQVMMPFCVEARQQLNAQHC